MKWLPKTFLAAIALAVALVPTVHVSAARAATLAVPWRWLEQLPQQARRDNCNYLGLVRSEPLISPDGRWGVYSRLDFSVSASGDRYLRSLWFAENQASGEVQVIYSPPAIPYASPNDRRVVDDFVMVLPLDWQDNRVLAREFIGLFQSNVFFDRALIWSASESVTPQLQVRELDPQQFLLTAVTGWDPEQAGAVEFVVGEMLGEPPAVASVNQEGRVTPQPTRPVPRLDLPGLQAPTEEPQSPASDSDSAQSVLDPGWESAWPRITGLSCRL